jgi:hypothetical protein
LILNKIAGKTTRRNVFEFIWGLFRKKTIFFQNKTIKIVLKVYLPNNLLGQKFLKKKKQQTKQSLSTWPKKTN